MNTQKKVIILIISLLFVTGVLYLFSINNFKDKGVNPGTNLEPVAADFDPLNTTYFIDDVQVSLVDGKYQSSESSVTAIDLPVLGDLNNDGLLDAALMLVEDTGGSGAFFYVVVAINNGNSTQGTNAILLGDRIAPQNIAIESGKIIANYLDREIGEPMTANPSIGVSTYLSLDGSILTKLFTPIQSITYLVSEADPAKYCDGENMDSLGYQETITVEKTNYSPELNTSILQFIKSTINAATTGMCRDALNQADINEDNGVVSISAIEGWAGISITMCSCQPLVEINLLQIPGITKVIWSSEIDNFESCVANGNPVIESYPRQCQDGDHNYVEDIGNELEKMDHIKLESPRPNERVTSPLTVKGQARGTWFFEASFPVVLTDWNGEIIAQGIASTQSDWMTSEFIPFEASLTFITDQTAYSSKGVLILKKDNPSDLSEHDDALEIPVIIN